MKKLTRAITVAGVLTFALATTAVANAEVELEPGATFDGGTCVEADGTQGIATFDGQCMTPADYDEIYSYENLSQIYYDEPQYAYTPEVYGKSVAEVYDIQPPEVDPTPASERIIGQGVTEPFTFVEYVAGVWGHGYL